MVRRESARTVGAGRTERGARPPGALQGGSLEGVEVSRTEQNKWRTLPHQRPLPSPGDVEPHGRAAQPTCSGACECQHVLVAT